MEAQLQKVVTVEPHAGRPHRTGTTLLHRSYWMVTRALAMRYGVTRFLTPSPERIVVFTVYSLQLV